MRSALTSTSYEAESLTRTASAAGSKVTSETGASAGAYVQFTGTAVVGDWIQLTLPNVVAGTYDVAMLYKSNTNRAIVQASIDGVDQGPSCDQYASTPAFQVRCSLGTATLSAGNHLIRFKVIGKRSSSTSYLEVIDQISLTASGGGSGTGGSGTGGSGTGGSGTGGSGTGGSGTGGSGTGGSGTGGSDTGGSGTGGSGGAGTGGTGGGAGSGGTAGGTSASYEAETLTRAASAAGSKVTTETGASAGAYVQFTSSTPAVGDWIEFTLPNVAAGTYDVAMLYKSNTNRAIVQASIDGVDQGPSCDQYASTPAFQVRCGLGTATLSAGNHLIRFKVIGKRSSSTSYLEVIDQISLGASGGGTGGTGGAGGAGGTVAYAPCPTNGTPCKILPFGDSITEGVRSSDGAGYRSQLFKLIVAASQKVTFTGSLAAGPTQVSGQTFPRMHEGHAGWTIDPGFSEFPNSGYGGISSLVPSPALNGSPHIVLLHIGANELFPTHDGVGMATR
ncbi:MAG: hypothetical protein ABIS92_14825, partial [Polyangia bacterium]